MNPPRWLVLPKQQAMLVTTQFLTQAAITITFSTCTLSTAQELPLGPLAQSMGLLRLPRMPELKKGSAANALEAFVASGVEPDSVKFKDKTREKQRQQVRVGRMGGFDMRCLGATAVHRHLSHLVQEVVMKRAGLWRLVD